MSRREPRSMRAAVAMPPPPPSRCAKVLYYTWKLCSVVFSHLVMISLVVAYCILGAVTFERLEAEHEREVKRNITHIRSNTTQSIWGMTRSVPLLNQTNWTSEVVDMLKDFENSLLLEMKVRGWDGNESTDHIQWTFTGALFYSIIVITTIGYGHITPRTQSGKVVTIFYAILGIPLMLLCLSNIGDVLASSFRFLYWRVCCYVCTRPPKRRRRHHPSVRRSVRGRTASTRRRRPPAAPAPAQLERAHSDTDFRYRDSGYSSGRARRGGGARLQTQGAQGGMGGQAGTGGQAALARGAPVGRTRSQPPSYAYTRGYEHGSRSPMRYERADRDDLELEEDFPKIALPLQDLAAALKDLDNHHERHSKIDVRSKSLPRPAKKDFGPPREWNSTRYPDAEDKDSNVFEMHDLHDVDCENFKERKALEERDERRGFRGGGEHEYEPCRDQGYDPGDEDLEFDTPRHRRTWDDRRIERGRSMYERDREDLGGSRGLRARSYVDYGHRWEDRHERERDRRWPDVEERKGRRLRRLQTVDDSRSYNARYSPSPAEDEWSDEEVIVTRRGKARQFNIYPAPEPIIREEVKIKPVPIWLCVFLVASYIVAGTFLFKRWESWAYLDAAYFCFITLTTIGFGDFVPAQGQSEQAGDATTAVHSIALCSLYLLFGIALLAMSFNLVQEEVRANVASLATKLGIIKSQRADDDDDDDESDY